VETNIAETAVGCYQTFSNDFRSRQQLLWMFASLLRWPRSRYVLQTSKVTMLFLKKLVDDSQHPPESEIAKKVSI
jgi:hypothetical protein